ncbi:hypothetical protein KHC33_15285 [Methanospirillum sp. J.3.6.1-F.2.7.3]|uniref:Uncharacterized protein n=1 Tax=Methanospirillum purgamenti TaxID=2834276 RepID=A0A8E7EGX6_9EURY|nr:MULTISPECIES: hypothetical protein [Methanospirillum]MDX8548976.1 hypothetical protein [Methanospirillum hungatei]QVV88663.1 hypothetical protein KHC33_15285 [Methanospirillum sp. J.3.6.1-F.2.7.3]
MRKRRRITKEYPRSILQLGGTKIRAGADLSYITHQIKAFLPGKPEDIHGC